MCVLSEIIAIFVRKQWSLSSHMLYGSPFSRYKTEHSQRGLRMEEQNLGLHSLAIDNLI